MLKVPRISLRFKLTGALVFLALLTVSLTGYFTIRSTYQALRHQKQQDELVMARNVAVQVDEVLGKAKQTLEALARYPSIQGMNPHHQLDALTLVTRVTELIDGIMVLDLKGRVLVTDQAEPDTNGLMPESPYNQFVLPVMHRNAAQYSDVYKSRMGEVAVGISAPIYQQGRLTGVLSGIILLRKHSMGGIDGIRIGKSGYAYIVDGEGDIIVHPQRERLLENLSAHPPVKELLKKRQGVLEFVNQEGIEVLGAFAPIEETGWGVVVRQPTSESYAYADEMFQFLTWVFVGSLVFALGVGVFLAWKISAPVTSLVRGVKQVGEGQWNVQIPVDSRVVLGQLARAFNEMTQKLQQHQEKILQAHKQLAQSEKMAAIGQLAAGLAHEINNPLNVVSGFSDFLLGKTPADDPRRSALEDISRETARCQKLVTELLHFAKPKASERTTADLDQLIQETLALVQNQTKAKGIAVETHLNGALPPLAVDRDQMKQVILNLFLNACQAMPEGGTLAVESGRVNGHVEVAVKDTGVGIPPENLENIFNPFFTTKEDGTGLGLALSYAIVEQHGGAIEVDSQAGRGAVFKVKLPVGKNT